MEKIHLKDYKPPDFQIESVDLEFDLAETSVTVTNKMHIKSLGASTLCLNGEKLELRSVSVNGKALSAGEYERTDQLLSIANVPKDFDLEIVTHFNPQQNTELSGLYFSGGYLCTQCEAEGFRRITYFMDRPDVMSTYHVTLRADKKKFPILLSNGNRLGHKDLADGRHEIEWEDPFKKPSYLFALVAGDLGAIRDEFVTSSQRKINLEIYAPHGKQHLCHHAMRSLKKAMRWDEERFGREYDLDDYMIVSIDDFNMGAMENKGLNIFNSRLVLANEETATDLDFYRIESVVGHEYFHNWTGNRITLRDWFHLSLKEGLTVYRDQEFSGDMTDTAIQRIEDVNSLRDRQFTEDASPNSHPVRPESCYSVDNFYTSTIYEKGAEVIRMMATIVGRLGFRNGMDTYFSRHDGQAVTIEDFVKSIAEPNQKNWDSFRRWYSQAGTPEVEVQEEYFKDRKEYHLNLKQKGGAQAFHIPLVFELFRPNGHLFDIHNTDISRNSEGQKLIELKNQSMKLVFNQIDERPVLSLLRGFSAPINLKWDRPDTDLFFQMTKDTDGFNRREAAIGLGLKFLSVALEESRQGRKIQGNNVFFEAYKILVDDQDMAPSFKALMLELPSDSLLIQRQSVFDADHFYHVKRWALSSLGQKFFTDLEKIYHHYHGQDAKGIDFAAAGKRRLKNLALHMMVQSANESTQHPIFERAAHQYKTAANMTDRMEALSTLATTSSPLFDELLEDFYSRYRKENVVLNKWFLLQSSSLRDDSFDRTKRLLNHADFNLKNPNNVYSLLGGFVNNVYCCHRQQSDIYPFIVDKILEIDRLNPQVASYLCGVFDYYEKMPEPQKSWLKHEAQRALSEPTLSKNCRELIEPILKEKHT